MSEFDRNAPIRVLHVIGIMNRGGAETMIMNLYRQIDREKVQFDFVEHSLEAAAYDEEIQRLGGRIYRCPHYTGKNHLAYVKWWNGFFEEHTGEYRIVHGHIGSTAAIYLSIAKKHGLFTVAHSHNSNGPLNPRELLYRILSYRTRFVADFFFACSKQAGEDRFGKRITGDSYRYTIFHNSVETAAFAYNPQKRNDVRKSFELTKEAWLIGHVGRFMEQKNHLFLIDVFSELFKLESNAKLLLVGDGPLRKQTEDKANELGLADRIIYTGVRSDVADLMQAMDILVFPSKNEGLPVTLVEAQAAGLPCVISDSIPEDSIITNNLVTTMSLRDPPELWAKHIFERKDETRTDHSAEVMAAGFDIRETARWLEGFYLDRAKQ